MAEYIMAFFLTERHDAPKPSKLFWLCHGFGWGTLSLVDSLFSFIIGASFYLCVFGFLLMVLVNSVTCLKLRQLIHGKNLLSFPLTKIWGKLSVYSLVLGLMAASTIRVLVSIFNFIWPQGDIFSSTADIHPLTAIFMNWLSLSMFTFLWSLIYVAVKYSNQLKEAQKVSAELALELKNAQLNTLMSQLNPHFLFNSLNNIRGLILEDAAKSREMLTRLAEMLRYSLLSDRQEFETLENELSVVHAYLKLASIQYEERLQYTEEIDTGLLNSDIPPMLIQMLIENAVKYGIDQTEVGGEIKLSILKLDDKMIVNVTNPGDLSHEHFESTGLGVKNIEKRLHLLYGDEASFSIRQEAKSVIVTVVLPHEFLKLEHTEQIQKATSTSNNQPPQESTKLNYASEPVTQ